MPERMTQLTLFDCCWRCRAPLVWLLAEAGNPKGRYHRLWRCVSCESLTRTGWVPPSWINATQRVWMALSAELADAVEDAYTLPDDDHWTGSR